MKYVLDTCSYFWLVDDQTKLSAAALSAIGDANNSLHLSAITVTEIHRLVRRGKIAIHAPNGLEDWFQKGLTQHGVICEPITLAIAHAAEMLPPLHNDPADRFILATAKVLGGRILSPDTIMPK
ncbi:MAG: type II toxin-antitoxin system VapC family toxin [Verrucomicrobiales bacterium]|nr:type II toxin-antitoxin system VapC family toxin [Verrucomicrobiales bacterium]